MNQDTIHVYVLMAVVFAALFWGLSVLFKALRWVFSVVKPKEDEEARVVVENMQKLGFYALEMQRMKIIYEALFHSDEMLNAVSYSTMKIKDKVTSYSAEKLKKVVLEYDFSGGTELHDLQREVIFAAAHQYSRGAALIDREWSQHDMDYLHSKKPVDVEHFEYLTEVALAIQKLIDPQNLHQHVYFSSPKHVTEELGYLKDFRLRVLTQCAMLFVDYMGGGRIGHGGVDNGAFKVEYLSWEYDVRWAVTIKGFNEYAIYTCMRDDNGNLCERVMRSDSSFQVARSLRR